MSTLTVTNGAVELAVERLGPDEGEPMLLMMAIGGQLIDWPDGLCGALIAEGFTLARFDNRDAGLSTRFSGTGAPKQLTMLLRPDRAAAYTLDDMAGDACAVMDAVGWSSAHIVGMSLGGMIGQVLAATHPDRVRSLTSIASTPAAKIGKPGLRTLMRVVKTADPRRVKTADDMGQYVVDLDRVTGSPAYPRPEDELRAHGRRLFERGGMDLAAVQRQTAAIAAAGDRRAQLATVRAPTLVLHGDADPMILPSAGRETARAIPGASLVTYPGMGHSLPRELWPAIAAEIGALTRQAAGNAEALDEPRSDQ